MKVGDRDPPFELYLSELVNGVVTPVDLTTSDVSIVMVNSITKEVKVNQPMTVIDAPNGHIQYEWEEGDTDTAASYLIVIKLTDINTEHVRTFPDEGYLHLEIEKNYPS
jgi:hypothetical protein